MPRKISSGVGANATTRGSNQSHEDNPEDVWSRPNWPPRLEKVFVELLLEEMKVHFNVCATGFSDKIWDHVTEEFRKVTGLSYDKKELKKHLAVLKKRYRIVKPLYNHGGFGWDYRRKMVEVHDVIWKDYIEAHPQIAPYRKYGCPLYDDLCTIFTKPTATGRLAMSPATASEWLAQVNTSKSRANSNKRRSTQPLGSAPSKRVATKSSGTNGIVERPTGLRPTGNAPSTQTNGVVIVLD